MNQLSGFRPAQTPILKIENARNKKDSIEEFKLFCKKECLPKNLREVDLKLLEMNTRTNCLNLSKNITSYDEIPEEQKKMINLKYDLKKIEKALKSDQFNITNLKKKIGIKRQKRKHQYRNFNTKFESFSPVKLRMDENQDFSTKLIENSVNKSQNEGTNSSKTPTNCSYRSTTRKYLKSGIDEIQPEVKSSFSNHRKKKMHIRIAVDCDKSSNTIVINKEEKQNTHSTYGSPNKQNICFFKHQKQTPSTDKTYERCGTPSKIINDNKNKMIQMKVNNVAFRCKSPFSPSKFNRTKFAKKA